MPQTRTTDVGQVPGLSQANLSQKSSPGLSMLRGIQETSSKAQVFFLLILFIYLFIYGCVVSSFLCEGFLKLWQAGTTLHRGALASHYRGLSCFGAQAPDAQAQ